MDQSLKIRLKFITKFDYVSLRHYGKKACFIFQFTMRSPTLPIGVEFYRFFPTCRPPRVPCGHSHSKVMKVFNLWFDFFLLIAPLATVWQFRKSPLMSIQLTSIKNNLYQWVFGQKIKKNQSPISNLRANMEKKSIILSTVF